MSAPTYPPGLVNSGLDAAAGSYEAICRATVDYWTGALARGATPLGMSLDAIEWLTLLTKRDQPQWASDNHVVAEWPIARLRDFSAAPPVETIPTLLLPPQAGHDSCIIDYSPDQSQIRSALDSGLTRVFALDWVGANQETKDASIEDYLAVIGEVVERLGGRVNLVGDCQGGWLAVIYAAIHPETVHTLTIAGAPIDFHAGEPLIHDWIRVLSPARDLNFYRRIVDCNDGVLPGEVLLAGFVALQPDTEIGRQLQLLAHINEPAHVERYRTFETWFKHTQPIPGAFYLWIVEHLFQNNELVSGELIVDGAAVDLGRIACPLFLLAGAADHITPPAQVFVLADYAATSPAQIHKRQTTGGHLGLFMGHEALHNHWVPVFGEIAALSQ